MQRWTWILACGMSAGFASTLHAWQNTWFVDDDAPPGGNGTEWEEAFDNLQDALDAAAISEGDDRINVAEGVYVPTKRTDTYERVLRSVTFVLINDTTYFGGYAGVGAANPDARDIDLFETTLSGQLSVPDEVSNPACEEGAGDCFIANGTPGCYEPLNYCCGTVCQIDSYCCDVAWDQDCVDLAFEVCPRSLHAYHVVTIDDLDSSVKVDGFTIAAGRADGNDDPNGVADNFRGGGMLLNYEGTSGGDNRPGITRSFFWLNFAIDGGGLYIDTAEGLGVALHSQWHGSGVLVARSVARDEVGGTL